MRELLNEYNLVYLSFTELLQGFERIKIDADAAMSAATFRNVLDGMAQEFRQRIK